MRELAFIMHLCPMTILDENTNVHVYVYVLYVYHRQIRLFFSCWDKG